jgi:hypothetical protein
MTKKELDIWYKYIIAIKNDWHFEPEDTKELLRLNHLVMEASHKIHNDNMLSK